MGGSRWIGYAALFTLLAAAPALADVIVVDTVPPGARIYVGSELIGVSGKAFERPPGASIDVTFKLDGYLDDSRHLPLPLPDGTVQHIGPIDLQPTFWHAWSGTIAGACVLLGLAALLFQRRVRHLDQQEPPSASDLPQVPGYETLQRLGSGGMAEVYKGRAGGRNVAIKLINPELSRDPAFRPRFEREVRLLRSIDDPAVVKVFDSGEHNGQLFLVMELVPGEPLKVPPDGLPLDQAMAILRPVMEAVQRVHSAGIVHRDLKPDNILRTAAGSVKLIDFGLAKGLATVRFTATGAILGTPAYMAPEQITEADAVPASDQYALGVLAYELLSGRLPFSNEDPYSVLTQRLAEDPIPLATVRAGLPPALVEAVHRMLAREPEGRYASVGAALTALEQAVQAGA